MCKLWKDKVGNNPDMKIEKIKFEKSKEFIEVFLF